MPQVKNYEIEVLDSPLHYAGIPLMTCDMAKYRSTEMNSEYVIRSSSSVSTSTEIIRNGYNSLLKINFDNLNDPSDYVELAVSCFGKIVDKTPMPEELAGLVEGVSFRVVSFDNPFELLVEAQDNAGNVINSARYAVGQELMKEYKAFIK